MPQTDTRSSVLQSVLADVLEEAAFSFGEPVNEPPYRAGFVLMALLQYSGDGKGELALAVPEEYAGELAANFLGLEPEETDDAARRDAVGEILNIVAGIAAAELFGCEATVNLSLPIIAEVTAAAFEKYVEGASGNTTLLIDEEYSVDLTLGPGETI